MAFLESENLNTMGGVDFPVDSQKFQHTGEKGMFVRLVAIPKPGVQIPSGEGMQECLLDGHLVGDDRPKLPLFDAPRKPQSIASENFDAEMARCRSAKHFLFPWHQTGSAQSRDCLAILTLGSTNWCGHDGEAYWNCEKKNLNALGRLIH